MTVGILLDFSGFLFPQPKKKKNKKREREKERTWWSAGYLPWRLRGLQKGITGSHRVGRLMGGAAPCPTAENLRFNSRYKIQSSALHRAS